MTHLDPLSAAKGLPPVLFKMDMAKSGHPGVSGHTVSKAQHEEASSSKVPPSDIPPQNDEADVADVHPSPQNKLNIQSQKRRAMNPPELQEASKKMSTAFTALNNVLTSKERSKDEEECDLFCKMLAKQIKQYSKIEREEIMYELHGVMLKRRRRFDRMLQARTYTVSSPSQIINDE